MRFINMSNHLLQQDIVLPKGVATVTTQSLNGTRRFQHQLYVSVSCPGMLRDAWINIVESVERKHGDAID